MSTPSDNWPRVSDVLKVLDHTYGNVPAHVLTNAAERGERLHRLCLSALASLDGLCSMPTNILTSDMNAFDAFRQWVEIHRIEPIAVEQSSICRLHRYRGTPDALVKYGSAGIPTLIDLKFTASILPINRVQIQAYGKLDLYEEAKQLLLLHIDPITGHLRKIIVKHNSRDWAAFQNALSVWRWRQA